MLFSAAAESDVGIAKKTNQDSVCVKIAETPYGQIAMALICDGMGGLEKGEVASAAVIREFSTWFEHELPDAMASFEWESVGKKWTQMIKLLNRSIGDYGKYYGISLGTTATAILMFRDEYMIAHVGDSRAYEVSTELCQLTEDHSVVGREVRQGLLTEEEAERDPRRNVLLQCIGASMSVEPQIVRGKIKENASYLLCSDGFRHVLSPEEIMNAVNPQTVNTPKAMKNALRGLINTDMSRGERDNISALLVYARA